MPTSDESIVQLAQQVKAKRQAYRRDHPKGNGQDRTESDSKRVTPIGDSVVLLQASDVTPEPICWLWEGWMAKGKLHILAGPPGTGKTNLILAIAAVLTKGGRLPSGDMATPCNVVIWSGEDSAEDTLIPRLIANGADRQRIYIVSAVKTRKGIHRSFDPAVDMPLLRTALTQIDNVGLLIVDSVASVVLGDSHKNNQVRRALQPLVDLAAELKCAAFGLTHLTKGSAERDPIDRLLGSIAFGALARIVLMAVAISEENGGGWLLIRVKSNIGPDGGGYQYDIHRGALPDYPEINTSWTLFGDFKEGNSRDLLALAESIADSEERSAVKEAKDFLEEYLANGPMLSTEIEAAAADKGIAIRTLNRSKKALRVTSSRGFDRKWKWSLPVKNVSQNVGNVGYLGKAGYLDKLGNVKNTLSSDNQNRVQDCQDKVQDCQDCQPLAIFDPDVNQEVSVKIANIANFTGGKEENHGNGEISDNNQVLVKFSNEFIMTATPPSCHDCTRWRSEKAGCADRIGVIRNPTEPPCEGNDFEKIP